MEKLELWKQNEPLFAKKLNEEVKTVNALIDEYNQSKGQINGASENVTYPNFETYKHNFLEMWDNDGEGVVLSGYDNGFIGESGLYARLNPVKVGICEYVPSNHCLQKIADYSCLREGGFLYQEVTIRECSDTIENVELKYQNTLYLPRDTATKKYKRLSRITADCKFAGSYNSLASETVTKWKAIAVNQSYFDTITSSCSCSCSCSCSFTPQYKVTFFYKCLAQSGVCNWVRTNLLCGVNMRIPTTCNSMFMDYQQLMRFCGNELQVAYQWRCNGSNYWHIANLPSMQ